MTNKIKYTLEHLEKVRDYINDENMTKKKATIKAGFSDPSLYYKTLNRLCIREFLSFKRETDDFI